MVADVTLVVLVPIGAWLLYVLVRRIYEAEQTRREGVLADGTVVEVYTALSRGGSRIIAAYEYTDANGGSHRGKSPDLADSPNLGVIPGSRCTIRFNPKHPERSVWISDSAT